MAGSSALAVVLPEGVDLLMEGALAMRVI